MTQSVGSSSDSQDGARVSSVKSTHPLKKVEIGSAKVSTTALKPLARMYGIDAGQRQNASFGDLPRCVDGGDFEFKSTVIYTQKKFQALSPLAQIGKIPSTHLQRNRPETRGKSG
ncbi:MAG: hypothetical protein WBG66_01455 [Geitlerinemataceae cyanobacterium]